MITKFNDYAELTFLSEVMQIELFKRHEHGTLETGMDSGKEQILYTEEDVLILLQMLIAEKNAH